MIPRDDLPISYRQLAEAQIILKHTARACGLTREEIHLYTRKREISHARFLSAFLMKGMTKLSLCQIAFVLSGPNKQKFDHSGIAYGIRKTWERLTKDDDFHSFHKNLAKTIRLDLDSLCSKLIPLKDVS